MWLGQRSRHLLPTTTTAAVPSPGPASVVPNSWTFSTLSTAVALESVLPASQTTGDRVIQVSVLSKRDGAPFADRLGAAIGAVTGCFLLIIIFFCCCKSRGEGGSSTPTSLATSPPKPYSPTVTHHQRRHIYRQRPIRRQPRSIPAETITSTEVSEPVTSDPSIQRNGTPIEDPGTSRPPEESRTRGPAPGNIPPAQDGEPTQAQPDRPNIPLQRDQQPSQNLRVQVTDENGTPATAPPGVPPNPDHDSQSSSAGRTSIHSVLPRIQRRPIGWARRPAQRRQSQSLHPSAAVPPPAAQPSGQANAQPSGQAAAQPTVEDLLRAQAEARQRALDEGRRMGYTEGIRDGHDLGYRQGFYQRPPQIFQHRAGT